mmetsp:Transcript_67047/g.107429  ORF Transcript_67047/g.107429 Transcript_67047/m.107429 type:complete len:81 (-) Transcript_67047:171-413(-)
MQSKCWVLHPHAHNHIHTHTQPPSSIMLHDLATQDGDKLPLIRVVLKNGHQMHLAWKHAWKPNLMHFCTTQYPQHSAQCR